jgi:hypothetical protein
MHSLTAAIVLVVAQVTVAPDQSQNVFELIARGVPATDRTWTTDDAERFAASVQTMAAEAPRTLPRFDSEASGRVMARLVSEANYVSLRDRTLPASARMTRAVQFTVAVALMTQAYITASNAGFGSFDREIVELLALNLRLHTVTWEVFDELYGAMTEEQRTALAPTLDRMRGGTSAITSHLLLCFTDEATYRVPELRRLAQLVAPTMPQLVGRLSEEGQAELRARASEVVAKVGDDVLRADVQTLLPVASPDCH